MAMKKPLLKLVKSTETEENARIHKYIFYTLGWSEKFEF